MLQSRLPADSLILKIDLDVKELLLEEKKRWEMAVRTRRETGVERGWLKRDLAVEELICKQTGGQADASEWT